MATIYIIVSIGIVVVAFLSFIPKLDSIRERFSEGFGFLLTLIATVVGVFLALGLSQNLEQKRKEEKVSQLFETAVQDLNSAEISIFIAKSVLSLDSVGLRDTLVQNSICEVLYFPAITKQILQSELILETISPQSFSFANVNLHVFEIKFSKIMSGKTSKLDIQESLGDLIRTLKLLQKGLVSELLFLRGELDGDELVDAWFCFTAIYQTEPTYDCPLETSKMTLIQDLHRNLSKRKFLRN